MLRFIEKKSLRTILAMLLLVGPATAALAEPSYQEKLLARINAAQKDRQVLRATIRRGRVAAGFCVLCHGDDGNSSNPEIPHLAEQNPVYLLDSIERFTNGRRTDYIMSPLAKNLTADEKVALVVFYSSQKRKDTGSLNLNPKLVFTGREIYGRECASCHGDDGKGRVGYSYIAGQPVKYTVSTLVNFREREKGRTDPLMIAVSQTLSNNDIDALAAYIASLR